MNRLLELCLIAAMGTTLCGCSGFLSNNGGGGSQQAENLNLAMQGGGYLSSDTANDITPFMYRDNSGNAYLFFASDRSGTMAVYYAQMNPAGKFYNLTELGTDINQPGTADFSPVVFNNSVSTYITYLSVSAGATNILTYPVTPAFRTNGSMASEIGIYDATHISYLAGASSLLIVEKSLPYQVSEYHWNAGYWMGPTVITVSAPHNSVAGFQSANGSFACLYMLYDSTSGPKRQLNGEVSVTGPANAYSAMNMPGYASSANDAYPFIDTADNYKVYFASDRYGKGYYDLYRYNNTSYNNQVPQNMRNLPQAIYVAPTGSDSSPSGGILPSSPVQTITAAIQNAFSWGINNVFLQAGIYASGTGLQSSASGAVAVTSTTNLTVTGGYSSDFKAPSGQSFFNNNTSMPGLYLSYCSGITFNNIVIMNGSYGGMQINNSSGLTFNNIAISNNSSGQSGGGILFYFSQGNIFNNCSIVSNYSSGNGGGIYFDQNVGGNSLNNCLIMNNAVNSAYFGAGIFGFTGIINFFINTTVINNIPDNISTNNAPPT